MSNRTLSVKQVCEYLGISRPTLYKLVNLKILTKYESVIGRGRGGQRVYFDSDEVEQLSRRIASFDNDHILNK